MSVRVIVGDCRQELAQLEAGSVQTCVTSPPYYSLRDYGVDGQIGLEPSVDEYVDEMVRVFAEVRRVLADDGTLWLNLGDSYCAGGNGSRDPEKWPKQSRNDHRVKHFKRRGLGGEIKPKDLIGVPWRVAFALQADGWVLRSEITWCKTAPMPESVRDRPTTATEKIFLFAKQGRYFYDADAVRVPTVTESNERDRSSESWAQGALRTPMGKGAREWNNPDGRNLWNYWLLGPEPYAEAHFATFPTEVASRCIKAGSREGDTVLDPFGGAGTTGLVADRLQRHAILIELNPEYAEMSRRRIHADAPLLAEVV